MANNGLSAGKGKATLQNDHSKKHLSNTPKPIPSSPVPNKAHGKSTGAHASPGKGISDMAKRGKTADKTHGRGK